MFRTSNITFSLLVLLAPDIFTIFRPAGRGPPRRRKWNIAQHARTESEKVDIGSRNIGW